MNILLLPFEETLTINIDGKNISIVTFKTQEPGNIKFGIEAPRSIQVHREEIYHAIKQKQLSEETENA